MLKDVQYSDPPDIHEQLCFEQNQTYYKASSISELKLCAHSQPQIELFCQYNFH